MSGIDREERKTQALEYADATMSKMDDKTQNFQPLGSSRNGIMLKPYQAKLPADKQLKKEFNEMSIEKKTGLTVLVAAAIITFIEIILFVVVNIFTMYWATSGSLGQLMLSGAVIVATAMIIQAVADARI